ncbi:transposase [Fischerella sp. PCC 9605]|uniref:transposase n=1 Tax=Fischerella sp. PCC 9605 TaxID=1173024 RepID=UPI0004B70F4E|nr:transposase [Fischerella sp. PCC 9605]
MLEQALSSQGSILKAIDTAQRLADAPDGAVVVLASQAPTQPDVQQRAQQRRAKRLKTYQKVWQLHQQGWSLKAIAQKVKLSSRTVQRYLLSPSFPERQGRSDKGRSLLNPYKAYLLQQYNQGRRQVKVLFREIQKQGYKGSYMTVTRYMRQLAQAQGVTLRQYPTRRRLPPVADSPRPALTPTRAAFLILRQTQTLQSEEQQLVQRLTQQAELADAIRLAQDFAQLVRQRQSKQFDPWLEQAEQSQLAPFERLARSLREDYDAVKAGITLSTSNGQVEGQINRLKMRPSTDVRTSRNGFARATVPLGELESKRRFNWCVDLSAHLYYRVYF